MTLKELIDKHGLKAGDRITYDYESWHQIVYIGKEHVITFNDFGHEYSWKLFSEGWEIYKEPIKPLTLEVIVFWKKYTDENENEFIFPVFNEHLEPFIGKRTRMVLTEMLCDCHNHGRQVCDICQGVST